METVREKAGIGGGSLKGNEGGRKQGNREYSKTAATHLAEFHQA